MNVNNRELQSFQELIKGYKQRVSTATGYMALAAELLAGVRAEQDAMIARLGDMLATQCSLRKKDFDALVDRLVCERRRRQESLPSLIADFRRREDAVLGRLRRTFSAGPAELARAWPALKDQILSLQRMRERDVARALKRVHVEQEELSRALKALLQKGERVRIADLKAVVREMDAISLQELGDLAEVLRDCKSACAEVSKVWQKVV